MGLFGKSKPADPKALVNEWTKKIRKESYGLDRQIRQIQRQEQVAIRSIKEASKKGDTASAKILAREVVHSRKAVSKIYTAKANLSSVEMQMKGRAKMDMKFATNYFKMTLFKAIQISIKFVKHAYA